MAFRVAMWWILCYAGLSVFALAAPLEDKDRYGVLLDAGSSSTKLKIYKWQNPTTPQSLPKIHLMYNSKSSPGLSTFAHDKVKLREYIEHIITEARSKVPKQSHSQTPIYLMATAGLRFLPANDAKRLMEGTKSLLQDKDFSPFVYTPAGVEILSGEEEGVYAWIAANYLLGFFDQKRSELDSTGVLEMGGGSTQITFVPRDPLYAGEFKVTVAGREYGLYVHSYLNFGFDAITLQLANELAKINKDSKLNDPCRLRGDTKDVTLPDGRQLALTGSGDPDTCKQILSNLLRPATGMDCEPKPCAVGSVYQPSVGDGQFLATQVFTFAPQRLNATGEGNRLDLVKLEDAAYRFCKKSIQEAVAAGFSEKHASGECLMAIYTSALFTLSYGFPKDTQNIKVTSKVGDQTIDWAIGAMLVELSKSICSVTRRK
ncbi:ectonucleoside triphosphate diphosphohydrolase 1-like [Physella acuta]|uniref:ectonucleoside triphosphate diphosphohydrolase 1-like n=1 Tax=Physella acuta TaxID=109671 RepID=UPI0027DDD4CE|nr:ectonucleoside triphosphate diphosphohydrolase 1-like [Physella acuta]